MCAICEVPLKAEKYRDIINYRVENLSDKKIEDFASNWWHILEPQFEEEEAHSSLKESELYKLDNIEAVRLRRSVTIVLNSLLDEYIYEKGGYRRDVAEVCLKGTWYIITGGLSWGDLPTDAFETISMLDDSGILEGLGAATPHID